MKCEARSGSSSIILLCGTALCSEVQLAGLLPGRPTAVWSQLDARSTRTTCNQRAVPGWTRLAPGRTRAPEAERDMCATDESV